ncbi:MAG: HTH domain-containing protein [Verrucomicrobia bacterium]|nr:HTH domain-containing protein [Verrucomicrobiota bacterium]MDA1086935.1 HTH domain-containing protein [Verrucomicrobiota bacterium]
MSSIQQLKDRQKDIRKQLERGVKAATALKKRIQSKEREIQALKKQLAAVEGGSATAIVGVKRVRNKINQRDLVVQILKESKKPLSLDEIMQRMIAKGYKFASQAPKRALSVTIYPDKKTFKKVGRSMFTLKK